MFLIKNKILLLFLSSLTFVINIYQLKEKFHLCLILFLIKKATKLKSPQKLQTKNCMNKISYILIS